MNGQIIWAPGVPLETMIQQAVEASMTFYRGNKTAAARSLGISIRTLDARIDKYKRERSENEQRISETEQRRRDFIARQRAIPVGASFDTSATPSLHSAEVERRRAARAETGQGVQPEPTPRVAAK